MRLFNVDLNSVAEPGSTVITPSPLLASAASEQIININLEAGWTSWQQSEALGISAWLTSCWQTVRYRRTDTPTLLSASQEQALWQRVIGQEHPALFHQAGTARLAIEATRLIAEWRIPLEHEAWGDYKDAQQFRELLQRVRGFCKGKGWITCSDLWTLVPAWIAKGYIDPGPVVFAGFERFSPAAQEVREALGHRATLAPLNSSERYQSGVGKACESFAGEVEYAARWARHLVEEEPNRSVGVFVPDLASHYPLLERTFKQVFYPSHSLRFAGSRGNEPVPPLSIFHINGSKPLSSHPLIVSALLLLELARPQIAMADASSILRCPFITGTTAEASSRALADIKLRRRRDLDVTLYQMESSTENCPLLKPVWNAVRQVLRARSWTLELSRWSEMISDLLEAVGWPGDVDLSSEEQEVVEGWKNALLDLAGVGLVSTPVSFEAAHSYLRRILGSACGPRIGDSLSPVQILDANDAGGLEFDCAAVVGMSDEIWPTPDKSWPLVPSKLRREAQVPGNEPQSLQKERQRRTQSLFQSATVLATYSGRLAPVARNFIQAMAVEPVVWEGHLPVRSYPIAALESMEDTIAPPFGADEIAAGGVGIIKSQSLCPFRAFAEYRLHAGSPEDACFGIDARDRGSFLHRALEQVWTHLQTLERLQNTAADELRELVGAAVAEVIQDRPENPFHQQINQAERERLEAVIVQWLHFERERKVPFTVEHLEEKKFINLNGLRLELRVDRIDRLPDGSVILIDYKSGDLKAKDLEGSRPSEPQLLIYAAAIEETVEGIYIAKVKPRKPESVGFAHKEHFPVSKYARKKTSWAQVRDESREHLHSIAAEFVRGYAAVKPEKGACTYCDLTAVCRILEGTRIDEDEDSFD